MFDVQPVAAPPHRRPASRPRSLESLEPRRLFDTLVFDGTAGDDVMVVQIFKGAIITTLNGTDTIWGDALYDAIDVRGLDGNDQIRINSSGDNDIFVRGDNLDGSGAGDDVIDLGLGNLDSLATPVVVTAGGGSDLVRLNDANSIFSDPFTVTSTTAGRIFFGGLTYGADLESLVISNGRGNSTITVESTSPATLVSIHSGDGSDTFNVNQTDPASPLIVLSAPGNDLVNVNPDGGGPAAVRFTETLRLFSLSINPGGVATVAPGGERVLILGQLLLSGDAALDLTDNNAIIDYGGLSPIAQVQSGLASGYAGGAWTGSGIRSSTAAASGNTAVGYAEATDLFTTFPATFAGQSVDSTSILLRHTLYGDADLNRVVNLNDFNQLAANFGQGPRRWSQGNFDFDAVVNLNDFNRLAANFGQDLP